MSPQIAPPSQPFALADIVHTCYASGELNSHAFATFTSTRRITGVTSAIEHQLWAEHHGRVGFDEPPSFRLRQQPVGCERCARARGGAWRLLQALL